MKSLVTGGGGFIGAHIVDKLIEKGHEVICVDDESAESNDEFFYNEKAIKINHFQCWGGKTLQIYKKVIKINDLK